MIQPNSLKYELSVQIAGFKLKSKQKSLLLKRKTIGMTGGTIVVSDVHCSLFTASATVTATATATRTTTTSTRKLLSRVSDMNSKNSFKLAKNKRKISKNSVKKIQKNKSLNKDIHFLSPSACLLYTSPSPRD